MRDCGARKRLEVPVPDVRARVAAIELLLREGLGRPATTEDTSVARMPASVDAVAAMSWYDLRVLFAGMFVDEIADFRDRGGEEYLRSRVAALDDDQRQALRVALA